MAASPDILKIAIAGASGRMGHMLIEAVHQAPDCHLAGALDRADSAVLGQDAGAFAGAIAVVFIIIGGYQYIASGGNEETAEKGKKTLVNAIIGIVVIVLAYAIINVLVNLVGSNSGYGF